MKNRHAILVCSTCASVWQNGKRVGVSGGQKLLEELTQQSQNWSHSSAFTIQSVECMSACSNSCVIAFTAPGKFTYLFGNLSYDSNSFTAVLKCANLYFQKPDGIMSWSERPEPLKKGIIARIPNCI
jgi:predicted metal-binding protein